MISLAGKRIFIIEDDVYNRAVMLTALQQSGAKTFFDPWGDDTIDRMKRAGHIDLILMDLMLPRGRTGYDVFQQLQTVPELTHIPVVVVSASDPALEMKKAHAMGFFGYIAKPINYVTFVRMIDRILDGQAIWGDEYV